MAKMKKLEKDIQREICDWLSQEGLFFWRENTIPVFEKGHFRSLPKYAKRGLPDVMVIKEGKLIGLEVKAQGYWKYTDEQQACKEMFIANGAYYKVVTSLEEVQEFFKNVYI